MVNWKEYKIINKIVISKSNSLYIRFDLDNYVSYYKASEKYIRFIHEFPFAEYSEDDMIKIDNDHTSQWDKGSSFCLKDNVIFKFKSMVLIRTQNENSSLRRQISELENKLSKLESNSNTNNTLRRDAESSLSIVRRERDGLLIEKKDLEREKNEWRTKFNNKNRDYEDEKEKREKLQKELDKLKDEKINEVRKHNNEISRKERENSALRVEKTREEEQKNAANSQVIDLSRRLENKEEELSVVRREKENQENTLLTKIDQKQQLLENARQSLVDLRVENEREKVEKDIEINEKNSQLREKETELKRKEEEIKKLRNQKGLSKEELLNEKLSSEKSNLELLANELKINLEKIHSLTKYHERLFVAQKDHNQANIDIHEANISRVKQELADQEIRVVHIQEICRKCKRIAELHWELEQTQQQFQAQQEVPTNN